MAALLRCARFLPASRLTHALNAIERKTSTDVFSAHSKLVQTFPAVGNSFIWRGIVTAPRPYRNEQGEVRGQDELKSYIYTVNNIYRKYGRISLRDGEDLLRLSRKAELQSDNVVMLIRLFGDPLNDCHPTKRTEILHQFWEELKGRGFEFNVIHYNALLQAYLENNHPFQPVDVLAEMESKNIPPNRVTFLRLIGGYCAQGDIKGACQILEHMKSQNMPLSEVAFASLITGHFKAGDEKGALGIFDIMQESGIVPSSQTYGALLCGYASKGNMEAIKKTVNEMDAVYVNMHANDLLAVVFQLAQSGHKQYVEEVLNIIKEHGKMYRANCVCCATQLICHKYYDVAYKVFEAMPRTGSSDDYIRNYGRFMFRAFIESKVPVDKLSSLVKDMRTKGLVSDDLSLVPFYAYLKNETDYALEVLQKMKSEGMAIRPHYFWPAFIQYKKEKNKDGILKTLKMMQPLEFSDVDLKMSFGEYAYPALIAIGESVDQIEKSLKDIGFSTNLLFFPRVFVRVREAGLMRALQEATEQNSQLLSDAEKITLAMEASTLSHEWKETFECLAQISQKSIHPVQIERIEKILTTVLNKFIREKKWNYLEEALGFMIEKKLHIKDDMDLRRRGAPESCIMKMKEMEGEQDLSVTDLKKLVDESDVFDIAFLKDLLIRLCQEGNVQEAEKYKDKLLSSGYEVDLALHRAFMLMYANLEGAYEKTLECWNQINEQYPGISHWTHYHVAIAVQETERGLLEEAIKRLESNKPLQIDSKSHNQYCNLYRRLFEAAWKKGGNDAVIRLTSVFKEGSLSSLIQGNAMAAVVKSGDAVKINEMIAYLSEQQETKMIMVFDEAFKFFMQKDDAQGLQKVVDKLFQDADQDQWILVNLMRNFLECGKVPQARRALQSISTEKLGAALIRMCEELNKNNKETSIEKVANFVGKSRITVADREEILFQLMRGYLLKNEHEKALAVLSRLEEEEIPPRQRTLRYLAKVLQARGLPIPFDVPAVQESTKDQEQSQHEQRPSQQEKQVQSQHEQRPSRQEKQVQSQQVSTPDAERQLPPSGKEFKHFRRTLSHEAFELLEKKKFSEVMKIKERLDAAEGALHSGRDFLLKLARDLQASKLYVARAYLFRELGEAGDISTLQYLSYSSGNFRLAHDAAKNMIEAYLKQNKVEDLLKFLESDLSFTSKNLTAKGIEKIATKHEDYLPRVEMICERSAQLSKDPAFCLKSLWQYLFIHDPPRADALLKKYPEMQLSLHTSYVVSKIREDNNVQLLQALQNIVQKNDSNYFMVKECELSLHCQRGKIEEAEQVHQYLQKSNWRLKNEVQQQYEETVLGKRNQNKPWQVGEESSDSSSDSDSVQQRA
ncbi:hypothetical protein CHS0354_042720 [Potamilus streckersoni]|uniref:Pentatricopeptide repeat-containing protein-mitochondrial domain-containing protein n=1 Tax=Potamilus streckersoni TaxID=2493646 RepID=A0AAE0VRR5_9BIVA|nr:hypothetical protein CHS0354_042720 [Potamilus streckersoni]